jgi:hypothetical protein
MLHDVPQGFGSAPAVSEETFASLLAAFTAPKPSLRPSWSDDGLADDVATLSYENALRTHARYRYPEADDRALTQPAHAATAQVDSYELAPVDEAQSARLCAPSPSGESPHAAAARPASVSIQQKLKSASVTIRLSESERTQLDRRAADAGLTVSAYLRSCTFEAESLRALVKDTMAQLKAATAPKTDAVLAPRSLLGRLFTPRRTGRPAARV